MRATLFHNPTAGEEEYSADRLLRLLRDHGIEARYQSTEKEGWGTAVGEPGDLVVVAGGDGSIAKVAKGLTHREIPLAILPTGTANNIARSFGIRGTPEQLVPTWDLTRTRPLDVGAAVGPWGKRRFVESVGLGAFAKAIALADSAAPPEGGETRAEELARARGILVAAISATRVRDLSYEVDGTAAECEYLLLEIMSTSHFGPAVRLAPWADPGDGLLDVAIVGTQGIAEFERYLTGEPDGDPDVLRVCTTRAAEVIFIWDGRPLHIDDEVFAGLPEAGGRERVRIRIEESIRVLVPG